MGKRRMVSFLLLGVAVLATAGAARQLRDQAVESRPDRRALMWYHFEQASNVLEGLVEGDLNAAHVAAIQLADMAVPQGLPSAGVRYVDEIRTAAARAAGADTLSVAAAATASVLTLCGECHVAVGADVQPVPVPQPEAEGQTLEMSIHQRATEEMLQGLVVPSALEWRRGAERFRDAPLSFQDPSRNTTRTEEIGRTETRVHAVAEAAVAATDPTAQAGLYAQLVVTCAECHALHRDN